MRISDWSSDVCSSDLFVEGERDAPDLGEVAGPGDLVPDAEILYPQRHLVGSRLRVQAKQLGQRVVDRWIGITHRSKSLRSEEHTSELQSLMRISYAVFCLKTKIKTHILYKPNHLQHAH